MLKKNILVLSKTEMPTVLVFMTGKMDDLEQRKQFLQLAEATWNQMNDTY